ncbi:MAG: hypothetical protein ACREMV_03085, partial [Gemmatimonadales bacterium]
PGLRPDTAATPKTGFGGVFIQIQDPEGKPIAAQIYVDGEPVFNGPRYRADSLTAGEHRVSANRAGFVRPETTVTVIPGQRHDIILLMRKEHP